MRRLKVIAGFVLSVAFIIISAETIAKVTTTREMKDFDDYVSPEYPISVVLAHTKLKNADSEHRKMLREAERGFRDASENNIYKKIKTKFIKTNLEQVPALASDYNLSTDQNDISILLFKRGRHITTLTAKLELETARNTVYDLTKDAIDKNFGEYIDTLLKEIKKIETEIAIARASAPHYEYGPYGPWWDTWYHGYYYPYYRQNPGFGLYFGIH